MMCTVRRLILGIEVGMADAETNWIDFYVALTPVAQTAIWAGVSMVVLVTLRQPLKDLAEEFVRRVNQGDAITTPWLSLERSERERTVVEQVTKNIRAEILPADPAKAPSRANFDEAELDTLLRDVNERFVTLLFPAIDFPSRRESDIRVELYMTEWTTVSAFLNDAYGAATGEGIEIPIWTYGRYWQLRNARTNEVLKKKKLGVEIDGRPFDIFDVRPGDTLVAERIRS